MGVTEMVENFITFVTNFFNSIIAFFQGLGNLIETVLNMFG